MNEKRHLIINYFLVLWLALGITNAVAASLTDLAIGLTASANTVQVGQSFTFTMAVTNLGPVTSTSATVEDMLPSGLAYISSAGPGTYNSSDGSWNFVPGAVNAISRMTITVRATNTGTFTNTATITSSYPSDSNSANNTAGVIVTVNPIPSPPIVLTC